MKRATKFGSLAGQPGRMKRLVAVASGLAVGLGYCRAAQRDEEHGFPFTAALEWRKAAEFFGSFNSLSGHCWREWERIMGLPRRFACPVETAVGGSVGPALQAPAGAAIRVPREHFQFRLRRRWRRRKSFAGAPLA